MSPEEYGPNTAQVRAFLDRVRALSDDAWEQADRDERAAAAAYGKHDASTHHPALVRAGRFEGLENLLTAVGKEFGPPTPHIRRFLKILRAVSGLATCDLLTPREFAVAYGAFARVAPIGALGAGMALPFSIPSSLCGRFVTRLDGLSEADWNGVAVATAFRDAAIAPAAVREALAAATHHTPPDATQEALARWWRTAGPFQQSAEALRRLSRPLRHGEFWAATAFAGGFADRQDALWDATQKAFLAVASWGAIPDDAFAVLYLPFAAALEPATLLDGHDSGARRDAR